MTKKAQTQQVFIYIMVIIVVGAMLIIGFRSVSNIMGQGCQVEYERFKTQLGSDIERNTRFGFVQEINLRAPCNYDQICFGGPPGENPDPVIDASMTAEAENVFLRQGRFMEPLFQNPSIERPPEQLCINSTAGRFVFRLEGIGQGKVSVSLP
ncbi:MAG: hypothetical protein ACMXX9_01960 [Candidatus Woesearchaeota archaeon]